jgi:hypothetical protein
MNIRLSGRACGMVDIAKVVAPAPMEGHGGYNRVMKGSISGTAQSGQFGYPAAGDG